MGARGFALVIAVALSGCREQTQKSPPDMAPPPLVVADKIDILFVIDDSPASTYLQDELRMKFPAFIRALESGAPASYHIGVVTSDLGAGHSTSLANCPVGGLGGRLQAIGREPPPGCGSLGGGLNFIDYNQITGENNLPLGQDLAMTFGCMAAVGDAGCGFEHPLESAYRALHDPIPENAGFLRPEAILVVFFLTEEDDCSAPPDTDLFDPLKAGTYGALLSYRCTNYGVMCGSPPSLPPYGDSGGPLANCTAATAAVGGKLFEVSRYIDFFSKEVKANPRQVIVASIAGPPEPFQTLVVNPANYEPCAPGQAIDGIRCGVVLRRSCANEELLRMGVAWFADPAVRIDQVVKGVRTFVQGSACDTDFTPTLQRLADAILTLRTSG